MKASIYFDPRKPIQTGENKDRCHIKILVQFDGDSRMRRYYKTGVYATKVEFQKIISGKYGRCSVAESEALESKRKTLLALEAKAKDVLQPGIHPEDFEPRFKSKGDHSNPLDMLLAHSEELKLAGDIGNGKIYKSAYSGFKAFVDDKYNGRLSFAQVTPKFLMSYENWQLERGRSIATVGTHVRPMRTIFNIEMDAGKVSRDNYPFGRRRYKCPTSRRRRIALSEQDKNTVLQYDGEYQWAVDLWKFSYYCNGMNFNDMARLRRRDIEDGLLSFIRHKTKHTNRDRTQIVITMHADAIRIMYKWGSKDLSPDAYIFPVLQPGLSPGSQKDRIADWIKKVNGDLSEARVTMKIPKITTYWARHTFATTLKRQGASIEYIQEALGHSDPRTTQLYLDSFDLETKRKYSNLL